MSNTFCLDFAPRVLNKHVALLFYFRKFSPLFFCLKILYILLFYLTNFKNIPTYTFICTLSLLGTLEYNYLVLVRTEGEELHRSSFRSISANLLYRVSLQIGMF